MTVNPEDVPDFEPSDESSVREIYPLSFMEPGGDGDFRPIILPADEGDDPKD